MLIPFVALCLVFTSCSKKTDDAVDLRDQMVGTYNRTATFTIQRSQVPSLGKPDTSGTETGTATVTKSTTSSDVIVITEIASPDFSYTGSGITGAGNGVGFNILQQTHPYKGTIITMGGISTYTIGSGKFDGAYTTENGNKLVYQIKGTQGITSNGTTINIPFTYNTTLVKQ